MRPHIWPWLAISIATAVTTFMDFNGLTVFSAFPLIVISLVFWPIIGLSKREMGLTWGTWKSYRYGLMYPLIVLSLTGLIFHLWSGIQFNQELFQKEHIQLLAGIVIGPLMVLLTEEGFFRGLLWGRVSKSGIEAHPNTLNHNRLVHGVAYLGSDLRNRLWITHRTGTCLPDQCVLVGIGMGAA